MCRGVTFAYIFDGASPLQPGPSHLPFGYRSFCVIYSYSVFRYFHFVSPNPKCKFCKARTHTFVFVLLSCSEIYRKHCRTVMDRPQSSNSAELLLSGFCSMWLTEFSSEGHQCWSVLPLPSRSQLFSCRHVRLSGHLCLLGSETFNPQVGSLLTAGFSRDFQSHDGQLL